MLTLFDFSKQIALYNKEKKYLDALKYFKENKSLFSVEQINNNEYIISDILSCIRHSGQFDAGFQFLSIFKIKIDAATKERVLNAYAWFLYSKYKAENTDEDLSKINLADDFFEEEDTLTTETNYHYTKSELIEKIESTITLLTNYNSDFSYNVMVFLFTIVLKTEKKKTNTNWKFICDFCDLINVEQLKTDCKTIEIERKGHKKDMELASDKETWYAYKSKALLKLGNFQECFELSLKAINSFEIFHYSNDIWLARRIALSKKSMGNSQDAISELLSILNKKKEWFIQKELAEIYKEIGDLEKALKYSIEAINNYGQFEFKVELFYLLGEILFEKKMNELSFKHYSLSKLIRENEGWNVPTKLQFILDSFKKQEYTIDKLNLLKQDLQNYWNSFNIPAHNQNSKNFVNGRIDKILNNNEKGIDGFIKTNNNRSIYFTIRSSDEIYTKIKLGLAVEFIIYPAKEGKKERASRIRLLNIT